MVSIEESRRLGDSKLVTGISWQKILITAFCLVVPMAIMYGVRGQLFEEFQDIQLTFIGGLSTLGILNAAGRQFISLQFIHWFFFFIFYFVGPAVRITYNLFPLVSFSPQAQTAIVEANWIIIIWGIVYGLSCENARASNVVFVLQSPVTSQNPKSGRTMAIVLTFGVLLSIGFFLLNPLVLFIRAESMFMTLDNQLLALIVEFCVRPFFMMFWFVAIKTNWVVSNETRGPVALLLFGLGFIAVLQNFPPAQSRFYSFAIYLAFFMTYLLKDKLAAGYTMIPVMFAAVTGSEVFNIFRSVPTSGSLDNLSVNAEYWGGIDFDAYEMLTSSVLYVERFGNTLGTNFTGAILFWVPRSLYPSKAIGSGHTIMINYYGADNPYGDFTNVSCPLVAEFYLAFGYVGIILGSFLVATATSTIDKSFRYLRDNPDLKMLSNQLHPLYFIMIGLYLFVMRGDLMSSTAFTVGIFLSYAIALLILRFELRLKVYVTA